VVLPPEETATPGRYRLTQHRFWEEVLDAWGDPALDDVAIKKCSQVGWTTLIMAMIGYAADTDPGRIMMVLPTVEDAEDASKERLEPLFEIAPKFREMFGLRKSRTGANTITSKRYRGGVLKLVGANAPRALASRPVKWLLMDEVGRFPMSAGKEGDPVQLARKRTDTFRRKRLGKRAYGSSPGMERSCRISALYEEGDRRLWLTPCPHCKADLDLDFFKHIHWDKDENGKHRPETAVCVCDHCGGVMSDWERVAAVQRGRWVAQSPEKPMRSYWVKGLMSPSATHVALARKWLACTTEEQRQTFYNTELGETWRERGEKPDAERLYERRETYQRGIVPAGAGILTLGVDVQRDRLEATAIAWGRGLENWTVDHFVLMGDPDRDEVWLQLDELRGRLWDSEAGATFRVAATGIDSGGLSTQRVYAYCMSRRDRSLYATKGSSTFMAPMWPQRPPKRKNGTQVWGWNKPVEIGVSLIKRELHAALSLPKPEPGVPAPRYCHFPELDREHFEQLTAEEEITRKDTRGFSHRAWHLTRARNEALDTWAINRALAEMLGLARWSDRQWDAAVGKAAPDQPPPPSETRVRPSMQAEPPRRDDAPPTRPPPQMSARERSRFARRVVGQGGL